MNDIRDPTKPKDLKQQGFNPTPTENDVSSIQSASKAQEPLTDEEIHIKEVEDSFHMEIDEDDPIEEYEIDW